MTNETTHEVTQENDSPPPRSRKRLLAMTLVGATAFAGGSFFLLGNDQEPVEAAAEGYTGVSVTQDGLGYALVADAGETYAFGSVDYGGENPAGYEGSITDISVTGDGKGYVEVSTRGQVFAYGSAEMFQEPTDFSGDIAGIAVTADGKGYVAVSTEGQIYAYGSVKYQDENPSGFDNGIADIAVTADGQGYAVVSGAGQVYAYGTVEYFENPEGFTGDIADIAVTADGKGYAVVSSAGQVYAYGTVKFHDNPIGFTGDIVGIAVTGDGAGYVAMSGTGQVYAFGTVGHLGNGDPGIIDTPLLTTEIAEIAAAEAANPDRNVEVPGDNCNFYTGAVGADAPECGEQGWLAEAWCADFARWVWGEAGADTADLTAGAVSFQTYGENRGTWKEGADAANAQVGDAVFFGRGDGTDDDHVGIVTAVNGDGTITMISGNSSNSVKVDENFDPVADGGVTGYSSPVS